MAHLRNPRGGQWLGRDEPQNADHFDTRLRPLHPQPEFDWSSAAGAALLSARLIAFWRNAGHTSVRLTVIHPRPGPGKHLVGDRSHTPPGVHSLRSNLAAGLPPKK